MLSPRWGSGCNLSAELCGLILEDDGVLGVAHIGLVTDCTFLGGVIKARPHYDQSMKEATLSVDEVKVLEGGFACFKAKVSRPGPFSFMASSFCVR